MEADGVQGWLINTGIFISRGSIGMNVLDIIGGGGGYDWVIYEGVYIWIAPFKPGNYMFIHRKVAIKNIKGKIFILVLLLSLYHHVGRLNWL